MSVLSIKNVKKSFDDKLVLNDINLAVDNPGLYLLYGTSGCGKTTLLHIIAGFMKPDSGSVNIRENTEIAYSFQDSELLPDFTVAENIALANQLHAEDKDMDPIIQELNIAHLMKRYPHECSQGQKNRIALARALCMDAPILLVDEPTEALDADNRSRVKKLLQQAAETHIVIAVTHDREWIESADASVYELKYQKLTCIRSCKHHEALSLTAPKEVNQTILHKTMKRIMKQRMQTNGRLFLLLSIILVILALLPNVLFSEEYRKESLNANIIYIDRGFSKTAFSDQDAEVIPAFDSLPVETKRYKIRLYPYRENTAKLAINGKSTISGYEIIINQNTAEAIAQAQNIDVQQLLNQTLSVPFRLYGSEYFLDMKIVGIIQESDVAEQMQIYYHKPAVDAYLQTFYPKEQLIEDANVYMLEVPENEVVSTYENIQASYPAFELYNSMIYEHDSRIANFKSYRIIYTIITAVFICCTSLFYLYYQMKEMNAYLAQFVILHMCGVNESLLAKQYRRIKWHHHIGTAALSMILLLAGAYVIDVSELMLTASIGAILFIPLIAVFFISLRVKKASFGIVLQKDKDQK